MSSYSSSYGLGTRLSAQNTQSITNLNNIRKDLNSTLQSLGTGYKFNSPAEDPAGSTELTRLQAKVYGVEAAISNNQYSFHALSGVDAAQSAILSTIMEIRSHVLDASNENNSDIQDALLAQVSTAINGINIFSNSVDIGGKKVLAGDTNFDLSEASGVISPDDSHIRTMLDDSFLAVSFNKNNAAEQAYVSGTLNLPDSGAGETHSLFDVTTDKGTRRIQINATNPVNAAAQADALSTINQQLADIGVYAEYNNDTSELYFLSEQYGENSYIKYDHVGGTQILTGVATAQDYGETGTVMVNGKNYNISGKYSNKASESAEVKGAFTDTVATDSTISVTTTHGSASFVFGAGEKVSDKLTDINTAFAAAGVKAEISDSELIFKTIDKGNDEVLIFNNTGTDQIFTAGADFTDSGREYENTNGLKTHISSSEIQGELAFDIDDVTNDVVNNTAITNQNFSLQPEGGVHFHISDGTSNLDSINYGFRDLSASGLGLEKIIDNSSEFYMLSNPNQALEYLDSVISVVRSEWTGLGSFMKHNLEAQTENLQQQLVSLAEQKSTIADVDEAYATTRATQLQLLQQANISALTVNASFAKSMTALLPSG